MKNSKGGSVRDSPGGSGECAVMHVPSTQNPHGGSAVRHSPGWQESGCAVRHAREGHSEKDAPIISSSSSSKIIASLNGNTDDGGMDDDTGVHGGMDDDTEVQRPSVPSKVREPTQLEREDHELSGHARYRSWCTHCVFGKGKGNPHVASGEKPEFPEIGLDFFYLNDDGGGYPHIAVKDRETGCFASTCLENKLSTVHVVAFLVGFLRSLAYRKVILCSDNEPALLNILKDVRLEMSEVEFVDRPSIEGDHAGNGLAEVGVRECKAQARILRSALDVWIEGDLVRLACETRCELHESVSYRCRWENSRTTSSW